MEATLLRTKIIIPPARLRPVVRPRLTQRLQEGWQHNLILVSAPAGFGKTTLLREWAHHCQPPIRTAWFSLDEGDNDPVRYWDYFIAALKNVEVATGEGLPALLLDIVLSGGIIPMLVREGYIEASATASARVAGG